MLLATILLNINNSEDVNAKVKKNKEDVAALRKIIHYERKRDAWVGRSINNKEQYTWNKETGHLEKIKWYHKGLRGTLDLNELKHLTEVDVSCNKLKGIKVNKSRKIKKLNCFYNKIKVLKVGKLKKLKELDCGDNKIKKLDLRKLKSLETFKLSGVNTYINFREIKILWPKDKKNIKVLEFVEVYDIDLNFNLFSNLTELCCWSCDLNTLNISKLKKLTILDCGWNKLKKLDLTNQCKLKVLDCSDNNLRKLDLSNQPKLEELYCEINKLRRLDLSNQRNLKKLICFDNKLTKLDLSGKTQLNMLGYEPLKSTNVILTGCDESTIRLYDRDYYYYGIR